MELGTSLKKAFWRGLALLVRNRKRKVDLPLDFAAIHSILVIRSDRLGDVILSTPVYESIKRSFPLIRLTVLANQANILADNPFIDRVISVDKKRPWRILRDLAGEKFDLVIVLNRAFSATAATFALLSKAPLRVGYETREGMAVYNVTLAGRKEPQHEIQNNLDLLRHIGVPTIHETPGIHFNDRETQKIDALLKEKNRFPDRPLVLVKPGTRVPAWGWPLEKFQAVCDRLLAEKRAEVFIIQGPGEEGMINSFFRAHVILPALSAKELACLIRRSRLLFCNHTGIMHMASAAQTPALVIFKHGETARWGPRDTRSRILEERNGATLSVEKALEAIDGILQLKS
jgi:heptosyltransferase-2